MDNSEFKRIRNTRGTEHAGERQRLPMEIRKAGEAAKVARGDSSQHRGERKSIIDPERQRQLDRTSLMLNPLGERRRRDLSGRPLNAEEGKIADGAAKRLEPKREILKKALSEVRAKR